MFEDGLKPSLDFPLYFVVDLVGLHHELLPPPNRLPVNELALPFPSVQATTRGRAVIRHAYLFEEGG